jgi:hypothetical protein
LYIFLEGFIFLGVVLYKSILLLSVLSFSSFCIYASSDDPSSPMGFDVISPAYALEASSGRRHPVYRSLGVGRSSEGATADDGIAFKVVTGDKSYFSTVTFFKNGDVTREVVGGPPTQAELIELALLFSEEFVMVEKHEQIPVSPEIVPEKRRSWSLWVTLMEKIHSFSR